MGEHPSTRRTVLLIFAVAVVYAVVAKLGLSLGAVSGFATLVWPPTGLALAALLLFGTRLWPGVMLGAWAVNVWMGAPVAVAAGIAAGNTLEALLGAYALRRFGRFHGTFDRLGPVLALVGAALAGPVVSATLGVSSLSLGGIVRSSGQAAETWHAWWLGDVLSDLVIAPLLLSWVRRADRAPPRAARVAEAIALAALLGLTTYVAFHGVQAYPLQAVYVLFPLFVWAALRFGLRGATLATAAASGLAIWGTARGGGPFAHGTLASGLLGLQTFMGCAALTPLVVAGVTMERSRALRVQETFVATVSHDLRSPLSALLMSAGLLARLLPEEKAVQRHHEVVKRSVDLMMRLVADISDATAIERGQLAVEKRPEDVIDLVREALGLLAPLAAAKKLTLDTPVVEPSSVLCDRRRLLQALCNVVGNAIKFSPDGAAITITARRVHDSVRFSIQDRGPGIEAAALGHVFERDWHAKPSSGGGTGLGLFIVKGIVETHGGRIWVESAVGVGSTFHLSVPAGDPSRP